MGDWNLGLQARLAGQPVASGRLVSCPDLVEHEASAVRVKPAPLRHGPHRPFIAIHAAGGRARRSLREPDLPVGVQLWAGDRAAIQFRQAEARWAEEDAHTAAALHQR